jgi:hypothetical protein
LIRHGVGGPGLGYVLAMHGSSEADVQVDPHVARTRKTGGVPDARPDDRPEGDAPGTTGTAQSEEFVGRVAGRDLDYAGWTGAEARAEAGKVNP